MNILTIDLEEWFHSLSPNPSGWGNFERRLDISIPPLLDLLDKNNSTATFFVLGEVAENNPSLIKSIHSRGHKIGSHNYYHHFIYNQTPKLFSEELLKTKQLLESLIGEQIISFRAPYFSVTNQSLWALEILKESGILYDSSIYPVYNHRYGIPRSPLLPYEIIPGLWEFPVSVYKIGHINFPFAGGVYFRFLKLSLFNHFRAQLKKDNTPFLFYIHPWEWDPQQPKFSGCSLFLRFRHYFNLHSTFNKMEYLLSHEKFISLEEAAFSFTKKREHYAQL